MKCSKCNNEIEDGSSVCAFCGAQVEKEQIQKEAEEQVVEVKEDVVVEKEKNEEKQEVKNNRKRPSIITIGICLIALIVILSIALFVAINSKDTEAIYKGAIKSAITDAYSYDSIGATTGNIRASVNVKTDLKEIKDYVDGMRLSTNVQYNTMVKKAMLVLTLDDTENSYINAKGMVDLEKNEAYVSESTLYDNIVKFNVSEDISKGLNEYINANNEIFVDKSSAKKATKIIASEINKNLNKELFTNQKTTININGKDKKVKDNVLKLTFEEFENVIENVTSNLKLNNKFLACFKSRDQIINALDKVEELRTFSEQKDGNIEVHVYTSGILARLEEMSFIVRQDNENFEEILISRVSNNVYNITLNSVQSGNKTTNLTLEVTLNKIGNSKKDFNIKMNIVDEGSIELRIVTSEQYNKENTFMDVTNTKNFEDLTSEEYANINKNFTNSKFYKKYSDYFNQVGSIFDFLPNNSTNSGDRDVPLGVTITDTQSFVKSYDEDIIVYEVPNTFEEEYAGVTYQRFIKEDKDLGTSYIDVVCNWNSIEEYEQTIDDLPSHYSEAEGYSNVQVSEPEQIVVGDNTFYKKVFTYTYSSGAYTYTKDKAYYYIPINDEYVFSVEIDDKGNIVTSSEIEKLLTIDVTLRK